MSYRNDDDEKLGLGLLAGAAGFLGGMWLANKKEKAAENRKAQEEQKQLVDYYNRCLEFFDISESGVLLEFKGNEAYSTIAIPSSVFGVTIHTIGEGAFVNADIETIELPKTITDIEDFAFSGCTASKIKLHNGIVRIGRAAFYKSGVVDVVIPDSVEEIGPSAFSECKRLRAVDWSLNCQQISSFCFSESDNLQKIFNIDTVETIGDTAFYKCHRLSSFDFPENLLSIGETAFYETALPVIDLMYTQVESIEKAAFAGGTNITDIRLPDTIRRIGEYAFGYLDNIQKLYIDININDLNSIEFDRPIMTTNDYYFGFRDSCVYMGEVESDSCEDMDNELRSRYLDILGLDEDFTKDELQKAFREKSRKFHPDMLYNKDLDPEIMEVLQNKFVEIKEAYDYLMNDFL